MLNVTTGDFEDTTMNNSDNFEAIAQDAVRVLITIIEGLRNNGSTEAALAGLILADQAEDLCRRAIALGGV